MAAERPLRAKSRLRCRRRLLVFSALAHTRSPFAELVASAFVRSRGTTLRSLFTVQ